MKIPTTNYIGYILLKYNILYVVSKKISLQLVVTL